jgi:hypothetical protein
MYERLYNKRLRFYNTGVIMVEVTFIDYRGDFVTPDGVNIPQELERASENLWQPVCTHWTPGHVRASL